MRRIAFTFIGNDRPGIIAEVTRALFETGCNIEDTTMTLLEGQFAMILIAEVPRGDIEEKLKKAFDRCQLIGGLHHYWKILKGKLIRGEKHPPGSQTQIISVMGKDRTGIVYETSRILANLGLNITDLNSKILGKGKNTIFAMVLEVDIPRGFSLKRLDPAWEKLRRKLNVDVRIKPVEHLTF